MRDTWEQENLEKNPNLYQSLLPGQYRGHCNKSRQYGMGDKNTEGDGIRQDAGRVCSSPAALCAVSYHSSVLAISPTSWPHCLSAYKTDSTYWSRAARPPCGIHVFVPLAERPLSWPLTSPPLSIPFPIQSTFMGEAARSAATPGCAWSDLIVGRRPTHHREIR